MSSSLSLVATTGDAPEFDPSRFEILHFSSLPGTSVIHALSDSERLQAFHWENLCHLKVNHRKVAEELLTGGYKRLTEFSSLPKNKGKVNAIKRFSIRDHEGRKGSYGSYSNNLYTNDINATFFHLGLLDTLLDALSSDKRSHTSPTCYKWSAIEDTDSSRIMKTYKNTYGRMSQSEDNLACIEKLIDALHSQPLSASVPKDRGKSDEMSENYCAQ